MFSTRFVAVITLALFAFQATAAPVQPEGTDLAPAVGDLKLPNTSNLVGVTPGVSSRGLLDDIAKVDTNPDHRREAVDTDIKGNYVEVGRGRSRKRGPARLSRDELVNSDPLGDAVHIDGLPKRGEFWEDLISLDNKSTRRRRSVSTSVPPAINVSPTIGDVASDNKGVNIINNAPGVAPRFFNFKNPFENLKDGLKIENPKRDSPELIDTDVENNGVRVNNMKRLVIDEPVVNVINGRDGLDGIASTGPIVDPKIVSLGKRVDACIPITVDKITGESMVNPACPPRPFDM